MRNFAAGLIFCLGLTILLVYFFVCEGHRAIVILLRYVDSLDPSLTSLLCNSQHVLFEPDRRVITQGFGPYRICERRMLK